MEYFLLNFKLFRTFTVFANPFSKHFSFIPYYALHETRYTTLNLTRIANQSNFPKSLLIFIEHAIRRKIICKPSDEYKTCKFNLCVQ